MNLYADEDCYKIYSGDMNDMESVIEQNSIDAIVTDPPYEINFMGRQWDASGIAFRPETWRHCWDVLKPGGYLLAFGGSRTFHRIACAIEDAGFEIRDTIMWLYGSGFPKSMNIGLAIDKKNGVESEVVGYSGGTMPDFRDVGRKQKAISGSDKLTFGQVENADRKDAPIYKAQNEWNGWGTALKPAYEPIIIARKPCEGSCVDNVLKYGVGGINIDECRITLEDSYKYKETNRHSRTTNVFTDDECGFDNSENRVASASPKGRFPSNLILTYDETNYDEVCGGFPNTTSTGGSGEASINYGQYCGGYQQGYVCDTLGGYGDSGSASRYFYCAKASKRDRDEGLDAFEEKQCVGGGGGIGDYLNDVNSCSGKYGSEKAPHKNTHPTVKPTALMSYLIRLVSPKGATILDPFMGSGSTGKSVMYENKDRNADYKFIGIELTDEYLPIAKARIDYVINNGVTLDRGEDETVDEASSEPKSRFERFTWDLE